MTSDRVGGDGKQKPANDNRPPEGQGAAGETDASERLDRVVLTIARLIGRQIAREHFEALQAENDNQPPAEDEVSPGAEDED
ncbi:hypothetical protein FHS82_003032 [Pseudochelatococcus lubricantis]|uniref:Uncharacterized protein n=1 Tax=Pseudochelatococcus lubricantis TaxID=1538102 RepID=A0ABX0V1T8_9HYPH|nr:hypothetical protein [Pseudochelatococcus lubricantis]NIJ59177.1 hypothetical protein [Pseudochelatococcus lubricantis]